MKETQEGEIGIVTSIEDYLPYSGNLEDMSAMMRLRDFTTNWLVQKLLKFVYLLIFHFLFFWYSIFNLYVLNFSTCNNKQDFGAIVPWALSSNHATTSWR